MTHQGSHSSVEDVSLKPLDDAIARLEEIRRHVLSGAEPVGLTHASHDGLYENGRAPYHVEGEMIG